MLATPIFLLPPIFGRLAPIPMGIDFARPGAFEQLGTAFHVGQLTSALVAFAIAALARRTGRPFVIAGLLTLIGSLLFEVPGGTAAWKNVYVHAAAIPTVPIALTAAVAGVAVGWGGLGRRAPPQTEPA